jgi:hypothetical protein
MDGGRLHRAILVLLSVPVECASTQPQRFGSLGDITLKMAESILQSCGLDFAQWW